MRRREVRRQCDGHTFQFRQLRHHDPPHLPRPLHRLHQETDEGLNFIVKLKENTARAYYAFMLECSATDKRYGESILKFDNDEILLWTSVIERAQKNGEIRSDINSFQMAKIFKRSFVA